MRSFRSDELPSAEEVVRRCWLAQIFDGSEQLISIVSVPFYTNQISLPEEVTQ